MAIRGSEWCPAHHPDHAERRRRGASRGGKRGGRGRPLGALAESKTSLRELADKVLSGAVVRADAAVVGQLLGTVVRVVNVEMRVREVEDLERKLEELERLVESRRGDR